MQAKYKLLTNHLPLLENDNSSKPVPGYDPGHTLGTGDQEPHTPQTDVTPFCFSEDQATPGKLVVLRMEPLKGVLPPQLQKWIHIFSEEEATCLPSHSGFDHAIDLMPGTQPSHRLIYSCNHKEQVALKSYIEDMTKKGPLFIANVICGGKRTGECALV
ncbi:hypothetical protein DSO57_1004224 [Entomophthora muscae]|uniref:Uncharacterized protein n=1 Tax=Entomophthora muscae TaxID=34485 RepID=A0ACC2RN34_9FUNG|nr:hypothetical protein DSO57_1004224 [Entomophthora muscae]